MTTDVSKPPIAGDDVDVLRAIVEGTASSTGDAFFRSLVQHLARAIDVRYAFIAEFSPSDSRTRVHTISYWAIDHFADNVTFDLSGTPCEDVVRGNLCHYPSEVYKRFPQDQALVKMGIESYLGVPLRDRDGRHLGHLAVFDQRPMPPEPRRLYLFRIFADRAAAELARIRYEQRLAESEQRFKDLFEEAPIAYVHE
ncbi:MAG TPA: GAF domain-containing protein, partial [Tepidisphaeraceae bacterium]|nr:GAF domain-containing protein [Tepidisphaeraceae bacterium]